MNVKADGFKFSEKARRALEIMAERRAKEVALADKYLGVIKSRTPVKTGETQRSWTIHFIRNDANSVEWEISPDGKEDIVGYLEFGTEPHVIVPKNPGGVLVFEWNGKTWFVTRVMHPGTKPLGIVRITQQEIKEDGQKLFSQMHARLRSLFH
jgi:hypothetical protein